MKNFYITLITIGLLFFMSVSMTGKNEKFYYAFNEKVSLIPKTDALLVKYAEGTEKIEAEKLIKGLSVDFKINWHNSLTAEIIARSQKEKNELLLKLKQNNLVNTCQPFYTLENGLDMGVTDEILIRFLPEVTDAQKQELQRKFNTRIIKTTKIYQKLEVMKGEDALEIANKYYETGLVEFATPNFLSYPELHQVIPNDTYFNMQITCHNTGQTFNDGHAGTNDADIDASEAWELTTGSSNIVIAVLDQGVTSNHPDLPNTRQVRLNGSNFGDGNANDPSPTGNANHGNACAGVIAATMNNNQGIAGIAPNCRVMPIRIFNSDGTGVSPDRIADAIEFAVDNGANILSNSWGYSSSNQNLHPVIVTAINYALTNNRVVLLFCRKYS
ncbi:S8 family serine peptidase [Gaoshiqia sp. Z1-71]|uniref:S8 family serine peptidase n=1 Tax=Gaoshiqia hydrogeniformans TaxID=3290090 RepID=UPI003BF910CB